MNHARILKAYICRLKLADVDAIAAAYRACWREQNSGNRGSQESADRHLEQTIAAAIANALPSDIANIETIMRRDMQ